MCPATAESGNVGDEPGATKAARPAEILRTERTWMGVDEALAVRREEGEEIPDIWWFERDERTGRNNGDRGSA